MTTWFYVLGSTVFISLLGLVGIVTFIMSVERLRRYLLLLVGLAAGGLIGDSFFHLLPEFVERRGGMDSTSSLLVVVGLLAFFFLEHGVRRWQIKDAHTHDHLPHMSHIAGTCPDEGKAPAAMTILRARPFAIVNVGGDLVHNFIDGLVVGGSFLVSPQVGLATALAVILHEIPHELGNFAVLVHAGLDRRRALLYNFLTALTAVAGGVAALVIGQANALFPLYLMPFTTGSFVYLAVGDLIPELHAHSKPGRLEPGVGGLLVGVILMGLMRALGH